MFKIKCYIDGELHKEMDINPGQELVIGRNDDVDIQLDPFPGISRKHAKLVHLGDKLIVEKISQAGKLVQDSQSEQAIEIVNAGQFSVPPYNFEVQHIVEETNDKEKQNDDFEVNEYKPESTKSYAGDFEKTTLSTQQLSAAFKLIEHGSIVDEYYMEEAKWTFGRAKTCNVFIDHDKASRQHFEVYKLNDKYYIKDLGSSNGTFLNGHQLPANNEIDLKSGDVISIDDYKLIFEIKDKLVEDQIQNLPEYYKPVDLGHLASSPLPKTGLGVKKVRTGWFQVSEWDKQKKFKVAATTAFLCVMAFLAFFPTGPNSSSIAQREVAALKQRAEENKLIENAKIAALQYMDQANWSHCLSEVQRIQDLRPDDPDASEIGLRCQTALEKLERQNQLEAQERDRQAIIQRVQLIVDECKDKVSLGSAATKECLQPAIELSPEDEQIAKLLDLADATDRELEAQKAKKEDYIRRLNAGLSILKQADGFKDRSSWEEAIKFYKKYIKGKYPDPKNQNRDRANREVASIQSALQSTLKKALNDAKIQYSNENYRDAVLAARRGLNIDEYNSELQKIETDAYSLLRIEIRSLYQDSILMEDLGKIHTAISKWKQIIERDIPGEDYFKKAESKLKNYETEI